MADALSVKVLDPLSYHRQFIDNGIRVDNRDLIESRQILARVNCLSESDYIGSALITIGDDNSASVMCSVNALVGRSATILKSQPESSVGIGTPSFSTAGCLSSSFSISSLLAIHSLNLSRSPQNHPERHQHTTSPCTTGGRAV